MDTIGIFDSGCGGLPILKSLTEHYLTRYIYIADTAYMPYGTRSPEIIIERTKKIVQFLIDHGATTIIVACHTASAIALDILKEYFPTIQFIDPLPLTIEIAAATTMSGRIGIMATPNSIASHKHKLMLLARNPSFFIIEQPCEKLAYMIEMQNAYQELAQTITEDIKTLKNADLDTVILGCTHYAFVESEIAKQLPHVKLISAHKEIYQMINNKPQSENQNLFIHIYITGTENNINILYEKLFQIKPKIKTITL